MTYPEGTVFPTESCSSCDGTGKRRLPPRCGKHGCSLVCDDSDMDMPRFCPACVAEAQLTIARSERDALAERLRQMEKPHSD